MGEFEFYRRNLVEDNRDHMGTRRVRAHSLSRSRNCSDWVGCVRHRHLSVRPAFIHRAERGRFDGLYEWPKGHFGRLIFHKYGVCGSQQFHS